MANLLSTLTGCGFNFAALIILQVMGAKQGSGLETGAGYKDACMRVLLKLTRGPDCRWSGFVVV